MIARDENWKPTGVDVLHSRANACEAFWLELGNAYAEQCATGTPFHLSREDIEHARAVAIHAKRQWEAAQYTELVRRWGVPADEKAALRLPLEPSQRALLLGGPPSVPSNPRFEPHAPGDFPDLKGGWSQELLHFIRGRRELSDALADRRRQTSFAEMSQPRERDDDDQPEREPGEDDAPHEPDPEMH